MTIGYGESDAIVDSSSMPVTTRLSPVSTTRLVPSRSTNRAESGATTIIVAA